MFPRIPENASLKASKTNQGWKVERPRSLAPDGKRLRFFFKTREKALEFAAKLKEQVNDHGANILAAMALTIDAEKRDSILGHLETEGLVTLTERLVAAVPAADYFRRIPARTGIKPPTLQSAHADVRSSAGGVLTSWSGAGGQKLGRRGP